MSMKKAERGDEIYYFDRTYSRRPERSKVKTGKVERLRWSDDGKVIGYQVGPRYWDRIKSIQYIGPFTDLTEP